MRATRLWIESSLSVPWALWIEIGEGSDNSSLQSVSFCSGIMSLFQGDVRLCSTKDRFWICQKNRGDRMRQNFDCSLVQQAAEHLTCTCRPLTYLSGPQKHDYYQLIFCLPSSATKPPPPPVVPPPWKAHPPPPAASPPLSFLTDTGLNPCSCPVAG